MLDSYPIETASTPAHVLRAPRSLAAYLKVRDGHHMYRETPLAPDGQAALEFAGYSRLFAGWSTNSWPARGGSPGAPYRYLQGVAHGTQCRSPLNVPLRWGLGSPPAASLARLTLLLLALFGLSRRVLYTSSRWACCWRAREHGRLASWATQAGLRWPGGIPWFGWVLQWVLQRAPLGSWYSSCTF
jgi:hypothetical protein